MNKVNNPKMKRFKNTLIFALCVFALSSCVSVKEYQKSRINDSEMEFETSFYLYREGATGANGGKGSGGCGCN
jgi:Domain of unknown function (DUF4266)